MRAISVTVKSALMLNLRRSVEIGVPDRSANQRCDRFSLRRTSAMVSATTRRSNAVTCRQYPSGRRRAREIRLGMTAYCSRSPAIVTRVKSSAEQYNAAVGRQLRAEIAAAGSSIAAMARDAGIARSALDNYVTGKRAIPVPVVYTVCEIVNVPPHLVLARAEERLSADTAGAPGNLTRLRRPNVAALDENVREVAFESHLPHDGDTDDLYQ
jgi:transcriptional regulator with XRE-family HTH domain